MVTTTAELKVIRCRRSVVHPTIGFSVVTTTAELKAVL